MSEDTPSPAKKSTASGTSKAAAAKKPPAAKPAAAKPATRKPAAKAVAAPAEPLATPVDAPSTAAPTPQPAPAPEPASGSASDVPPPPPPTTSPVQPARMLESEARTWSMLIYVLSLVLEYLSAGTLAFLAPLIIWLIHRQRSALVDWHGKQSLNMHLTSLVVMVCGFIIGIVTLGFGFLVTLPAMIAYVIYLTVMSIIAAVKANSGEYYRIPVVIRFVR